MATDAKSFRDSAAAHLAADRHDAALRDAWTALEHGPDDARNKVFVADVIRFCERSLAPQDVPALRRMIADPKVDPQPFAPAGWHSLLPELASCSAAPSETAAWLEGNAFAQELLSQAVVTVYDVEAILTRLRRWLLLEQKSRDFPRAADALAAQAALNGGAWIFEDDEKEASAGSGPFARAYQPHARLGSTRPDLGTGVTRAVAEQYEAWPYPQWTRVTWPRPRPLAEDLKSIVPDESVSVPDEPQILVAGCGSGREAALLAARYPDAKITAIDLSQSSLDYAAAHCSAAGLTAIEFVKLDLHRVGELGRTFDFIVCSGVLHHLPEPETGWKALTAVLAPRGVLRVMVYSRLARLNVRRAQTLLGELVQRPVDDDLLRAVRRRVIESDLKGIGRSRDFYTLAGVHDLLLHRHEDPFTVARIHSGTDALGLKLLAFGLPSPMHRSRYREANPHDPLFRDWAAWSALERRNPSLFAAMYEFWCCRIPA